MLKSPRCANRERSIESHSEPIDPDDLMNWTIVASVSGAVAVALGAFGAHGLKTRVGAEGLASWNTAVEYHLLHSVVLLALALYSAQDQPGPHWAMRAFLMGMLLFSGSIYSLVLGGPRWMGPITPVGGLCLIAGWLLLMTIRNGHA